MTFQGALKPALGEEPSSGASVGDELPAGTALCGGQYTIERFLNAGGFGITYLARDSLDRRVVIKECFPAVLCRRQGLSVQLRADRYMQDFTYLMGLFKREAQALARLKHPGVVEVHQIFEANGTAYMALDFVAGLDLFEVMESYPDFLTPPVIQSLSARVLAALAYVHENGILHRDISPDNILLDQSNAPILIDFGAARMERPGASHALTRVYTVKDGYSPQEFYFEGRAQSPASDLYAFAATLYHLITKSSPPTSSARVAAISEGEPDPYVPLGDHYPAYPPAFIDLIDQAMSLFAKNRVQSAEAWLETIQGGKRARKVGPISSIHSVERVTTAFPPDPETLEQISIIVEDNRESLAARAAEKKVEPKIDPEVVRKAEKRAKEIEYWAILNEDPEELARDAAEESAKAARAQEAAERAAKRAEEAKRAAEAERAAAAQAKEEAPEREKDTPEPKATNAQRSIKPKKPMKKRRSSKPQPSPPKPPQADATISG